MITDEEIKVVQKYWFSIAAQSNEITLDFYAQLFEEYPQYKPYFRADMKVQANKLARVLNIIINGSEVLDHLEPILLELGRLHGKIARFTPEDYENVCNTLIKVLERYKGYEDKGAQKAWKNIFSHISKIMLSVTEEIQNENI